VRTFTVAEANAALPEVRRLAAEVAQLVQLVPELQDEERIQAYRAARAGAGPEAAESLELSRAGLRDAELGLQRALAALENLGVMVKDPASGLLDFPSLRDGELVELCWRLGEEEVGHWHRIGEGFAGRKAV
jgi:hypothetical protein